MGEQPKLNLLLTHRQRTLHGESWQRTLSDLLAPMGVRTFEASTGSQALALIEEHPIHLAVVDTQLPQIDGLGVLRLVQRIRERSEAIPPLPPIGDKSGTAPPDPEGTVTVQVHGR